MAMVLLNVLNCNANGIIKLCLIVVVIVLLNCVQLFNVLELGI